MSLGSSKDGETPQSTSLQCSNASASSPPALLLLYDITSKMSFDNIRVSPAVGRECFSPGIGVVGALLGWLGVWGSWEPVLPVRTGCSGQAQPGGSSSQGTWLGAARLGEFCLRTW